MACGDKLMGRVEPPISPRTPRVGSLPGTKPPHPISPRTPRVGSLPGTKPLTPSLPARHVWGAARDKTPHPISPRTPRVGSRQGQSLHNIVLSRDACCRPSVVQSRRARMDGLRHDDLPRIHPMLCPPCHAGPHVLTSRGRLPPIWSHLARLLRYAAPCPPRCADTFGQERQVADATNQIQQRQTYSS